MEDNKPTPEQIQEAKKRTFCRRIPEYFLETKTDTQNPFSATQNVSFAMC